jgi:FMN phosphatase YigB (HAD superfamily)
MLLFLARQARAGYHAPVPRIRAVVTDLDNTLYPWVDYIVPCLEAMVDSLTATTGLPRIRIVQSLKEVYTRYESNEYPFAIQESDIFQPYERDFDSFNRLVVEPAASAFKAARARWLHPYPGVAETLQWIREQGLTLVALSDAPRNAALLRLKTLKLDRLFDALYTLPGYELPKNVDPGIRRREEAGHYRSGTPVHELPREAEKPSPLGLRRILQDFALRGPEVVYVGDNVKKDMPVARACGAIGVWAEYGTYISAEYRERLAVISARSVTARHVSDEGHERWPLAISSFAQVRDVVQGSRWTAPRAARSGRPPGARKRKERT